MESELGPGTAVEVARIKVSGLSAQHGVLWLASIRERLVARVDAASVNGIDVAAATATVALTYPHPVADVAPSPEGLWLVAGGGSNGRQCVLWSLTDGRELRRFDTPDGAGGGLAFHRERLWLTHRHNRRLLVLDPASGAVERVIATEHEVFSPSAMGDELWLVEAKTGPFGRFSPASETTFFFTAFDSDSELPRERIVAPAAVTSMASDGNWFWYAPKDATGLDQTARSALATAAR
jgi:hypothetical protein